MREQGIAVMEVFPVGKRARENPDWIPSLRVLNPDKIEAAWQRARKEAKARGERLTAMSVAKPAKIDPVTFRNWRRRKPDGSPKSTPDANQLLVLLHVLRCSLQEISDPL